MPTILVGTADGLWTHDGRRFLDEAVTHVAVADGDVWVLAGDRVLRGPLGAFEEVAALDGVGATCLLPTRHGSFVGAADARLFRVGEGPWARLPSFDAIGERDTWYTPWGGPPDVRAMTEASDGTIYVGVHVGGILRSRDGGETWTQTIDIDTDIHQVIAHEDLVIATGADALHVSRDGGDTWTPQTDGFDETYMRAVAVAGGTLLVTTAHSHGGKNSGVYRRALRADGPFERIEPAHPSADNIDTFWLAANDDQAVFVTAEGEAWRSTNEGATWDRVAEGLPDPRCVALV